MSNQKHTMLHLTFCALLLFLLTHRVFIYEFLPDLIPSPHASLKRRHSVLHASVSSSFLDAKDTFRKSSLYQQSFADVFLVGSIFYRSRICCYCSDSTSTCVLSHVAWLHALCMHIYSSAYFHPVTVCARSCWRFLGPTILRPQSYHHSFSSVWNELIYFIYFPHFYHNASLQASSPHTHTSSVSGYLEIQPAQSVRCRPATKQILYVAVCYRIHVAYFSKEASTRTRKQRKQRPTTVW